VKWPRLRAGLIAVAIGFGLIDGLPLPHVGFEAPWQHGYVGPVRAAQRVLEWPVAWIKPVLQIGQQWSLYQSPGGTQYRMWIEGRDARGAWQLVFRSGDPEHADDVSVITSARVHGAYQPAGGVAPQYRAFATWIAGRMLARHPELTAVRVQLEQIEIAHGAFASAGQFVWPVVLERAR
jgi:hypothetical protein